MKLLFDENVSPKLCRGLATEFPGSVHTSEAGLRGAEDHRIWDYCRANGFVLVSKDTDFRERSLAEGHPPKVVWLDVGNAGTDMIEDLLRRNLESLIEFEEQEELPFLVLHA